MVASTIMMIVRMIMMNLPQTAVGGFELAMLATIMIMFMTNLRMMMILFMKMMMILPRTALGGFGLAILATIMMMFMTI